MRRCRGYRTATMSKIGRLSEFDTAHPERWSSYVAWVENYFRVNQTYKNAIGGSQASSGQDIANPGTKMLEEEHSQGTVLGRLKEALAAQGIARPKTTHHGQTRETLGIRCRTSKEVELICHESRELLKSQPKSLHEGHLGIVRMKALMQSYLWWPGLDKDIEAQVHSCHICQQSRPEMPHAPVHQWETTQAPWFRIHVDFAGPFQGQLFLIVVDSHSKWLEVTLVPTMTTARTIQELRRIFATHGLPDLMVSDNGAQFTTAEFQSFLRANMIRHATSAPFHPASNSQVERMVRTTKESLKRIVTGNWQHRLADFLLCQCTTPCTSMGRSPAELRWGRHLITKLDRLHPDKVASQATQPKTPQ
ncbi:uncharacterized protein K02A2.6-like [Protobothrops mucrosquamatus]|uniref:uncharacterized protein K02A2.6-like n=1 Tax=Protobothrops mucrosquamatus TaxID=103944 RepID=UPI0010FB0D88|nr:uncharacterized protein K02A2.6-like [Protobothrops mucrosquamatus]